MDGISYPGDGKGICSNHLEDISRGCSGLWSQEEKEASILMITEYKENPQDYEEDVESDDSDDGDDSDDDSDDSDDS